MSTKVKGIFIGFFIAAGLVVVMAQGAANSTSLFNGATTGNPWAARFGVSAINLVKATTTTVRNALGSALVEKGGRWSVVSVPAAGSQATASIAAEAGAVHVVDCISWSADASGAVTAAAGTLVIRDGATGAGTIIWELAVAHLVAAAAGIQTMAPHSICGLALAGTVNTAMTGELNAGVTNEVQAVSISGYNVQ